MLIPLQIFQIWLLIFTSTHCINSVVFMLFKVISSNIMCVFPLLRLYKKLHLSSVCSRLRFIFGNGNGSPLKPRICLDLCLLLLLHSGIAFDVAVQSIQSYAFLNFTTLALAIFVSTRKLK